MQGYANQKRLLQRAGGRSAGREDLGYIFSPHGVAEVYVKPKLPASEKGGSISQAGSQLPFPRILSPGQGLGQSRAQSIPAPARDTVLTELVSHPHGLGKSSSQQVSCRHHLPPFSLPPLPWPEYCSLQNLCLVLFLGSEGLSQKFPHPEQQCHLVTVCSSLKWATATCQAHEE